MSKIMLTTALTLSLATPLFAESHSTEMKVEDTEATESLSTEMKEAGQAAENAMDEAAAETEQAAEAVAEETEEAADDVANAAENAAENVENTAEAAANEVEEETREPIEMADDTEFPKFDAPQMESEGWVTADGSKLTADDLTGVRVYDTQDEWIGEIEHIVMTKEGQVTGAVLGVGGFLGIGEKDVLVSFDSLQLQQISDGSEYRAYANMTEEDLEALPAYED